MNILITGNLGHIGSLLVKKIPQIKKIKNIYLIDNARSNNINTLFNYKFKNKKTFFIHGNILDKNTLKKIKAPINVVIHLASITNAAESFKIKNLIFNNNFGIFKKIVLFCIKKKAKLIHLSSTSVYGSSSSLVKEDCKLLKPLSPYANIKLMEENYLKKNKNKIKFITLRLGTITGVSQGMRFHTAVNKFCYNTILKEDIPVWNEAMNRVRPYLSLKDAIKTIIFLIKKNIFDQQTYNVLTGNYTVKHVLNIIKKQNYKIKVKKISSKLLNQNSYRVSAEKFKKFKIKFSKNIDNDIRDTLKLFRNINK